MSESKPVKPSSALRDALTRNEAMLAAEDVARGPSGVALDLLDANPFQPRSAMDADKLEELVASIRESGLIQAIAVRRVGERYQVVAGHRRLEAFRRLHAMATTDADKVRFACIPVRQMEAVTDEEMARHALVENLQRDDLDPVEVATGLARYRDSNSLTVDEVAKRTGIELRRLQRLLWLHVAPQVVKDGVTKGVMVAVFGDDGKPVVTPGGREKQEHRHLELNAALEFVRVHRQWNEADGKSRADARTEGAVRRALTDGWTLRRVQDFCRDVVAGVAVETPTVVAAVTLPAFKDDGRQFVVYRSRLAALDDIGRAQLRNAFESLMAVGQ